MSASIAIPRRKKHHGEGNPVATPDSTTSSSSSSFGYGSFSNNMNRSMNAPSNSTSSPQTTSYRDRRPSLMCTTARFPCPSSSLPSRFGSCNVDDTQRRCSAYVPVPVTRETKLNFGTAQAFTQAEHTVIDVGNSESPRLVR